MIEAIVILGLLEEAVGPKFVLERGMGIPWKIDDKECKEGSFMSVFTKEMWYICPTSLNKATQQNNGGPFTPMSDAEHALRGRGICRNMLLRYRSGTFCIQRFPGAPQIVKRGTKEFYISDPECAKKIRKFVYACYIETS